MSKQIILPNSWAEVSVQQFQSIEEIDENDPYRTEIVIKVLSGADLELISSIDVESRNKAINHLNWTNVFPDATYYKTEIVIENVVYNIVDLNELSLGNWIDLDNYCKKPIENLHKILSILYKCSNDNVKENQFLKANIGEVYQAVVFFSNIVSNLIYLLPLYLHKQAEMTLKNLEENYLKTDNLELTLKKEMQQN